MSSLSLSSSRRIREEKNEKPLLTGMLLGFQQLKERIIAATITTCHTTQQQQRVPSIIDMVGCDITIEDIQSAKQELIEQKADLNLDVNKWQKLPPLFGAITPLVHCCWTGNLRIVKVSFLIGADCT